jgi:hypothetical protein
MKRDMGPAGPFFLGRAPNAGQPLANAALIGPFLNG